MDFTIDAGKTQHIARVSCGGKDSTKMLDVIVSRGLPLDRITKTDVWATDTIRGEHPKMVEFEARYDEYIWKKYRIEVEHLCAMRNGEKVTYEKMFYHIPKRRVEKCGGGGLQAARNDSRVPDPLGAMVPIEPQAEREGAGHRSFIHKPWITQDSIKGFPVSFTRKGTWCQKLKAGFSLGPTPRGGKNIVEYIGIAADEPARFGQLNERKRAPLVEFGIEGGLCGLYCQYEGILAPTYETGCRDGCWMCHNQGVNQLRLLRRDYPELWALLLKWDNDSPVIFHPGKPVGHTVHDYDRRFELEDMGLVPADRRFRWEMLWEVGILLGQSCGEEGENG